VEKSASNSTESIEERLARERAEAREELRNADMGAFDRAIDALLKTGNSQKPSRKKKRLEQSEQF
jgi:hypothetical protein